MCNCRNHLKLISYKWDKNGLISYKCKCENCGELLLIDSEIEDKELKDLIDNSEIYKKFNL